GTSASSTCGGVADETSARIARQASGVQVHSDGPREAAGRRCSTDARSIWCPAHARRTAAVEFKEEEQMRSRRTRNLTAITLACAAATLSLPATAAALKVTWMKGFAAPATPAKYNKVGIIKVGPAKAKNVLVLAPGTPAGGASFVPLAQWLVSKLPGWQVWSEERRENLLEDQSVLNLAK